MSVTQHSKAVWLKQCDGSVGGYCHLRYRQQCLAGLSFQKGLRTDCFLPPRGG
jgi:hypothetical protein